MFILSCVVFLQPCISAPSLTHTVLLSAASLSCVYVTECLMTSSRTAMEVAVMWVQVVVMMAAHSSTHTHSMHSTHARLHPLSDPRTPWALLPLLSIHVITTTTIVLLLLHRHCHIHPPSPYILPHASHLISKTLLDPHALLSFPPTRATAAKETEFTYCFLRRLGACLYYLVDVFASLSHPAVSCVILNVVEGV